MDHSLQKPNQPRLKQWDLPGPFVGIEFGVDVGDGSTQISPNHSDDIQEWLVVVIGAVEVGIGGGEVIG
jgi:hypothetical protein